MNDTVERKCHETSERFEAHPTATIDGRVGAGSVVWAYAHIMAGAVVGRNCMIGEGVHVAGGAVMDADCRIQNGAQIFSGVTLDRAVFVGPHVVFTNVLTPRAFQRASGFVNTQVEEGASIGANATILCGITIGEFAIVGAGAVVTRSVHPHQVVVGNPAAPHSWVCVCGERIEKWRGLRARERRLCPKCNLAYVVTSTALEPTTKRSYGQAR